MATRRLTKSAAVTHSIESVFESFIEEKIATNLADKTISNYRDSYKRVVGYWEAKEEYVAQGFAEDISVINERYIYSFTNHLLKAEEDIVSPTSVNHYLRDIRAFLYWAMQRGYVAAFKIKLVTAQDTIPETYTDEEVQIAIKRPTNQDDFVEWRCWAIICWILATGNRANTVCNVKLGDLDFTKKQIALRVTKSKKPQIVPMSQQLYHDIKQFIKMWRAEAGNDDVLFPNISNEPCTTNALKQSIRAYNLERGIPKTSVHAYRHTFAKNFILNGGNVFKLQQMLGHSTLEMTRRYVNLFGADLQKGYEAVSPLDTFKKTQDRTKSIRRTDI